MRKKHSYGVALYRYNIKKNNRIEILFIKKRYTYHYLSFIIGNYESVKDEKYIKYLFDNMTINEKIDILSLNFANMWYRIWLTNPESINYSKSKNVEINYKNYIPQNQGVIDQRVGDTVKCYGISLGSVCIGVTHKSQTPQITVQKKKGKK